MAFKYADRVKETSTSTGTGNITLAGAVSGFRAFSTVYSNGDTLYYCITDQNGTAWETGIGTYNSSGTTLTRSTVKASSNSNAAVNFTSGALYVFVTSAADGLPSASGVTGTGKMVLDTGAHLTTPDVGAATGVSLNLVTGTGTLSTGNNVTQETLVYTTGPTVTGLYDGSPTTPSTINNPLAYIQRHVRSDLGTEGNQTVGGVFVDLEAYGSGTATPNRGAYIGGLYSTNAVSTNQGTSGAPNFDYKGDVIGLAGFAASSGAPYAGHIITGTWSWAKGPTLDATTYGNLPAGSWTICGHEINVSYDHPDPGVQTVLVGSGTTVGQLLNNYRPAGSGVKDWTFGIVLNGTPDTGGSLGTNVDNWNGYHTGMLIDKIKNVGLRFGTYFKDGTYGISFPAAFSGSQEPAAGIFMGGAKFNIGTYNGSTFNEGDIWQNGGSINYRHSSATQTFLTSAGTAGSYLPGRTDGSGVDTGGIGQVVTALSPVSGDNVNATVTMTIATPGVVTYTSHGLTTGAAVNFTTTGALPTGITAGTNYYIIRINANTFNVATSVANALAGTAVTTSGSQSGTHTCFQSVILTSASYRDANGMKLPVGIWDVIATISITGAGGALITGRVGQIALASGTSAPFGNTGFFFESGLSLTSNASMVLPIGKRTIISDGTTVVWGIVRATWTTGTCNACCSIEATRKG